MMILTANKQDMKTRYYVVGEGFVLGDTIGQQNATVSHLTPRCKLRIQAMQELGYTITKRNVPAF